MIGARPTRPWHSTRRPWHNTRRPWHPLRGFTLVELLVTITIISILAGVTLGALHAARQTAREAKTKSLITRLDQIIMQRYESYLIRRVPVNTRVIPRNDPKYMEKVARMRLDALRDLMRMEMPERWNDVAYGPVALPNRPALSQVYVARYGSNKPSAEFGPAECLYMIIISGSAGAMEQFSESDIGDADNDGWREFHDGWGEPIMFLRWAPGFSYRTDLGFNGASEIQSGDPATDHDPFDTRNLELDAFHLIPLIYSGGPDKQYDLEVNLTHHYQGDPYASGAGVPTDEDADGLNHHDNIHNHYIEQR